MRMLAAAVACALAPSLAQAANVLDLRATPTLAGARLRIAVKQPDGAANLRRFAAVHEHPMHLFVVGDGLEFFAHEHPVQQADGVFMVDVRLPRPGPYMAIVEFQPEGGAPQMVHQAFTTGSAFGRAARPALDPEPKAADGMRVSLDAAGLKAGERRLVTVRIEDAATSVPVADLEPYLGASAHFIAVSADMTEALHEHPQPDGRGGAVSFRPLVPRAGVFKVWVQFQRGGRATTAAFVIEVP
ncbi:MAG TPA: hypothetical protein VFK57_09370 [Vicinamibacterales bacterium]|nr:hypothetical protein [Vicinamibacterales bacterium]